MEIFNSILYFLITILVLVVVHEFGHFIAAKIFGMRVETFSIGFPPRAFGIKIGETDYCISWIPFGGYVKIAGIIDESMDTKFVESKPEPWEYRSKPVWQRMIVMSGGVIMNIILAIGIFWYLNFNYGAVERPVNQIGFVTPNSIAERIGIKAEDKIISINKNKIKNWDDINLFLIDDFGSNATFEIQRDSQKINLEATGAFLADISKSPFGIYPSNTEAIVSSVMSGQPAENIGLKANDVIIRINENLVFNEQQVIEHIRPNAKKEITIVWKRNEKILSSTVKPNEDGKIGIGLSSRYTGPVVKKSFSLTASFERAFTNVFAAVNTFYTSIASLISGNISFKESFGGPVKVAQMASQTANNGLISFLAFIAFFSINLAVINFLPIPALDGGHMVVLLIEMITRKPLSFKTQMIIQKVGWYFLLALMIFVVVNDFLNL